MRQKNTLIGVRETCVAVCIAALAGIGAGAAEPGEGKSAATRPTSSLELLAPFVGAEYRINANWIGNNTPLKARETWEWGLNKKFVVCKVFIEKTAAEGGGGGGEYQRYESVFHDENGTLMGIHMDYTGHVRSGPYEISGNVLTETWSGKMPAGTGEMKMKQELTLKEGKGYQWKVWVAGQMIMDGEWKKAE